MSRTFYTAVGGLLVLLGTLLGLTVVLNGLSPSTGTLIGMAVPIVLGLGLILLGLSNPYAPQTPTGENIPGAVNSSRRV